MTQLTDHVVNCVVSAMLPDFDMLSQILHSPAEVSATQGETYRSVEVRCTDMKCAANVYVVQMYSAR